MAAVAVLAGRILAGSAGALLIYSSLFLYREEEGRVENIIEQWWLRIRDLHAHAISRETAFLKVVADITSKGFAKLFGERLFGPKAVAASICYSQAAILLFFLSKLLLLAKPPAESLTIGILCLFFLFIGSLGPFIDRQWKKFFWLSSVVIATVGWPLLFEAMFNPSHFRDVSTAFWTLGEVIPFAIACDFLFIALTRLMLARAAQSNSFIKIATLAIGNACLAAVLFIGPLVGSQIIVDTHDHGHIPLAANLLLFVGFSNLLDALVSLTWFIIAIMMLLHRFFWPLIERPVYALFRHRVFTDQKKLVFFSGVALFGLAIPSVGRALEQLVKVVHG